MHKTSFQSKNISLWAARLIPIPLGLSYIIFFLVFIGNESNFVTNYHRERSEATPIPSSIHLNKFSNFFFTTKGFSAPEEWGRWTAWTECEAYLRIDPDSKEQFLVRIFVENVFVSSSHPSIQVSFLIEGEEYKSVIYHYSNPYDPFVEIPVNTASLDPEGFLRLRLEIDNPVSPSAISNSNDTRRLGIGISRIEILAHDPMESI